MNPNNSIFNPLTQKENLTNPNLVRESHNSAKGEQIPAWTGQRRPPRRPNLLNMNNINRSFQDMNAHHDHLQKTSSRVDPERQDYGNTLQNNMAQSHRIPSETSVNQFSTIGLGAPRQPPSMARAQHTQQHHHQQQQQQRQQQQQQHAFSSTHNETTAQNTGLDTQPVLANYQVEGEYGFDGTRFIEITQLHPKERCLFEGYQKFNILQSKCYQNIYNSDINMTIAAPTGCGKTVLFELAILRLFRDRIHNNGKVKSKAVYICPLKALCEERYNDWRARFGMLHIDVKQITGDTLNVNQEDLVSADVIITTPEKWDALTKRWNINKSSEDIMNKIQLLMLDEIHLLGERRGGTLEGAVSRCKMMRDMHRERVMAYGTTGDLISTPGANNADVGSRSRSKKTPGTTPTQVPISMLRIVAVSATIPNLDDVSKWVGGISINLGEKYRPVPLTRLIKSYNPASNPFLFGKSLNYKLYGLLCEHSNGLPALIFCATRKECAQAAEEIIKSSVSEEGRSVFVHSTDQRQRLEQAADRIKAPPIAKLVRQGVGVHTAGLEYSDRQVIERLFLTGDLLVVCTTSTLSQGINMPAHLVIIKGTQLYERGSGYREYSPSDIIQMMGRAGRPQFDTEGKAIIMTETSTRHLYETIEQTPIKSNLKDNFIEHLNAEIALQTVRNSVDATRWLQSTYMYVCSEKNAESIMDLLSTSLDKLVQAECTQKYSSNEQDDTYFLTPLLLGQIMAKYCLKFDAITGFVQLHGINSMEDLIDVVCYSPELNDIQVRMGEKGTLNTINKTGKQRLKSNEDVKYEIGLRYPLSRTSIRSPGDKLKILLQCGLDDDVQVGDHALKDDIMVLFQLLNRLIKGVIDYCQENRIYSGLKYARLLLKSCEQRLWALSQEVAKSYITACNCMTSQKLQFGEVCHPTCHDLGSGTTTMSTKGQPVTCTFYPIGLLTQLDGIGTRYRKLFVENNINTFEDLRQNLHNLPNYGIRDKNLGEKLKSQLNYLPSFALSVKLQQSTDPTSARVDVTLQQTNDNFIPRQKLGTDVIHAIVGSSENVVLWNQKWFLRAGTQQYMGSFIISMENDVVLDILLNGFIGFDYIVKISANHLKKIESTTTIDGVVKKHKRRTKASDAVEKDHASPSSIYTKKSRHGGHGGHGGQEAPSDTCEVVVDLAQPKPLNVENNNQTEREMDIDDWSFDVHDDVVTEPDQVKSPAKVTRSVKRATPSPPIPPPKAAASQPKHTTRPPNQTNQSIQQPNDEPLFQPPYKGQTYDGELREYVIRNPTDEQKRTMIFADKLHPDMEHDEAEHGQRGILKMIHSIPGSGNSIDAMMEATPPEITQSYINTFKAPPGKGVKPNLKPKTSTMLLDGVANIYNNETIRRSNVQIGSHGNPPSNTPPLPAGDPVETVTPRTSWLQQRTAPQHPKSNKASRNGSSGIGGADSRDKYRMKSPRYSQTEPSGIHPYQQNISHSRTPPIMTPPTRTPPATDRNGPLPTTTHKKGSSSSLIDQFESGAFQSTAPKQMQYHQYAEDHEYMPQEQHTPSEVSRPSAPLSAIELLRRKAGGVGGVGRIGPYNRKWEPQNRPKMSIPLMNINQMNHAGQDRATSLEFSRRVAPMNGQMGSGRPPSAPSLHARPFSNYHQQHPADMSHNQWNNREMNGWHHQDPSFPSDNSSQQQFRGQYEHHGGYSMPTHRMHQYPTQYSQYGQYGDQNHMSYGSSGPVMSATRAPPYSTPYTNSSSSIHSGSYPSGYQGMRDPMQQPQHDQYQSGYQQHQPQYRAGTNYTNYTNSGAQNPAVAPHYGQYQPGSAQHDAYNNIASGSMNHGYDPTEHAPLPASTLQDGYESTNDNPQFRVNFASGR